MTLMVSLRDARHWASDRSDVRISYRPGATANSSRDSTFFPSPFRSRVPQRLANPARRYRFFPGFTAARTRKRSGLRPVSALGNLKSLKRPHLSHTRRSPTMNRHLLRTLFPAPSQFAALSAVLVLSVSIPVVAQDAPKKKTPRLSMTPLIACSKIESYRQYKALNEPVLTADEKLLVYSEPLGFLVEPVEDRYQIHLAEDIRLRRKGEKKPLFSKDDAVDYKTKADSPNPVIFMRTVVALKGLPPGEYVLDLIVRDLAGKREPATQSLDFRVKPSPKPAADDADDDKPPAKPDKPPRKPRPK